MTLENMVSAVMTLMKEMRLKDRVAYQGRFADCMRRRKAPELEMIALY